MAKKKTTTKKEDIKRQAKKLAKANMEVEPSISRIVWFPDEHEIRLVEVDENIPMTHEEELQPFYFRPSPQDGLTVISAVVLIRPDEYGKRRLPEGGGDWEDGVILAKNGR